MLSSQEEQAERRRVLANDQRVKEQSGTFMSHTHDDLAGGRFAKVSPQTVVGAEPVPNYPAAAAHQHDPVPIEPPLGYSVNDLTPHELEPSMVSAYPVVEAQAGPADDAPLPLVSERSAVPSRPFRRIK